MLGPLDEYPVHQVPQPIAWPGSSDRNFYDRSYFNAHDRTGGIFLITGIGYYPNLAVKDAFVLVARRGGGKYGGDTHQQTAVHLSDAIDHNRLHQHVNGYRVEVIDPLQTLRIVMEETEGVELDLTWQGLFPVVQEQRHVLRAGNRVTLDAQRFAQLGSWSGHLVVDGHEIAVDPATWIGTRDRSWGIRPVGAADPAGRPDATDATGAPVRFEIESKLPVPIHVGGGYGGDSDWIHGVWKGEKFTERLTYEMTDPSIVGRSGFGVIDHVGRAICYDDSSALLEGWGLFEHGALGRHDPSGFADWLTVAP